MKKSASFEFPAAILNQINECSQGFFLVVINDKGEFENYFNADSPVHELGLINYVDVKSSALQSVIRAGTKKDLDEQGED